MITFNRRWEECTQDKAQIITREEKMGATEDQPLTVHTNKKFKTQRDSRITFIKTRRRTRNKRRPRDILPMFNAILVMKMDTL